MKKITAGVLTITFLTYMFFVTTASAAGTFVQSNTSDTVTTVNLTGVGAGNLIVLWVKWEGTTSGGATVSDGTSSLTMGTLSDPGNTAVGQFAYLLSANGGNRTYTVTFPSGYSYPRLRIAEFSYSGTVSLDAQNIGSGNSTACASGNIATTGTDEIVLGGYAEYSSNVLSSPLINGAASTFISGGTYGKMWYSILTATFSSGNASATLNGNSNWVCNIIAFKVTAASTERGKATGGNATVTLPTGILLIN